MSTVWVPKTANHDLSGAGEFGELLVVFPPDFSPFMLNRAAEVAAAAVKRCPPTKDDFMLFCGPPTLNVVLALELLQHVETMTVLVYHASKRIYIRRDLSSPGRKFGDQRSS